MDTINIEQFKNILHRDSEFIEQGIRLDEVSAEVLAETVEQIYFDAMQTLEPLMSGKVSQFQRQILSTCIQASSRVSGDFRDSLRNGGSEPLPLNGELDEKTEERLSQLNGRILARENLSEADIQVLIRCVLFFGRAITQINVMDQAGMLELSEAQKRFLLPVIAFGEKNLKVLYYEIARESRLPLDKKPLNL